MIDVSLYENSTLNQGCLLTPFQRKLLVKRLPTEPRPEYQRRIEIMLLADQGYSQTQICDRLGCCHETARYWVAIARAGNAHLWDETQIGRPKTVNEAYLNRLKELVSNSPRQYGYPFQRWTAQWLKKHLAKETGITVTEQHINRLLKSMGLSTRPLALRHESQGTVNLPQTEFTQTASFGIKQASIVIQDLKLMNLSN